MDYVLKTNGLCKKLANTMVVNNLNLNIRRGDIYGFIGPNGAGKTTAMKVILGLLFPTSGEIELFGQKRTEQSLHRVGALIEAPGLYTGCTAYENMKRFSILAGGNDNDIWGILDLVGLAGAGKKKVKAFSLGMKQRLGIALALLGNPELLILDEPVNGLDPMGMKDVRDVIQRIRAERGVTFFISSHLLGELEKICTVYGIINHGILTEEITSEEIAKRCTKSVYLCCDNPQRAAEIITNQLNIAIFDVKGNRMDISADPSRSADINTALVKGGVGVSELGVNVVNYEDYFISMMSAAPNPPMPPNNPAPIPPIPPFPNQGMPPQQQQQYQNFMPYPPMEIQKNDYQNYIPPVPPQQNPNQNQNPNLPEQNGNQQ